MLHADVLKTFKKFLRVWFPREHCGMCLSVCGCFFFFPPPTKAADNCFLPQHTKAVGKGGFCLRGDILRILLGKGRTCAQVWFTAACDLDPRGCGFVCLFASSLKWMWSSVDWVQAGGNGWLWFGYEFWDFSRFWHRLVAGQSLIITPSLLSGPSDLCKSKFIFRNNWSFSSHLCIEW